MESPKFYSNQAVDEEMDGNNNSNVIPPEEQMDAESKVQQFLDAEFAAPKASVKMAEEFGEYGSHSITVKCVAEFFGCLIFVFIGTMQSFGTEPAPVVNAAFAHGLTIFILIASLGHVSGGHFNPAVTTGIAVAGKMNPIHACLYIISQLIGGIVGSLLSVLVLGKDTFVHIGYGATFTNTSAAWYQCFTAELICTMFLVHTVLLTAVDSNLNLLAPLAIGLTVAADIFAIGKLTGGSMNPARSFGPNLVATIFNNTKLPTGFWSMHFVYYFLGPIIGAALAAGLFRLFYSREFRILK